MLALNKNLAVKVKIVNCKYDVGIYLLYSLGKLMSSGGRSSENVKIILSFVQKYSSDTYQTLTQWLSFGFLVEFK